MSLTGVINDDLLTLVHAHFIIIVITEGLLFLGVWEVGGAAVPGGVGGGRGCCSWGYGRWEGLLFLGVWEVGGAAVPGVWEVGVEVNRFELFVCFFVCLSFLC